MGGVENIQGKHVQAGHMKQARALKAPLGNFSPLVARMVYRCRQVEERSGACALRFFEMIHSTVDRPICAEPSIVS